MPHDTMPHSRVEISEGTSGMTVTEGQGQSTWEDWECAKFQRTSHSSTEMRRWEAKVTPTSYAFIFFQCITSEAVSKIVTKQLSLCFGNRNSPLTPHTSCVTCACRIIDFRSDSVL